MGDRRPEAAAAKIEARKAREAEAEINALGEHPDIEAVKRAADASGGRPRYGERDECDPKLLAQACFACGAAAADGRCDWDPLLHAPAFHPDGTRDHRTIVSTMPESRARVAAQDRIKALRRREHPHESAAPAAALTAPPEPSDGEAAPSPEDRPETHDSGSQALDGGPWSHQALQGHPESYDAAWWLAGSGGHAVATWDGAGSMSPEPGPGVKEMAELQAAAATGQAPLASERDILDGIRLSLWSIEGLLRRICNEHGDKLDALARIVARHGAAVKQEINDVNWRLDGSP